MLEAFAKVFELHSTDMTGANTIKSREFEGFYDIFCRCTTEVTLSRLGAEM